MWLIEQVGAWIEFGANFVLLCPAFCQRLCDQLVLCRGPRQWLWPRITAQLGNTILANSQKYSRIVVHHEVQPRVANWPPTIGTRNRLQTTLFRQRPQYSYT
jgi:hypothetical protein